MASKRRKSADDTWGVERTDILMDEIFNEARKQFGDNFYAGTEAEQLIVGLPIPALCLRYLFQSTVFPLSRMTIITGQEGSCKSAMLYEIFRWHRLFGGRNVLLECETKDSPDLRASILNYDTKACALKPCDSLEEWQQALTWFIEDCQTKMTGTKTKPGPGPIIPFCIGIDSLMAKASTENIEKIMKQGYADRAHPIEALKISSFMKCWPQKLFKWPFSVVATNHLKPTTDFMGRPGRNIPGGMAPKFQETYELEMARVGDLKRADYEGVNVTITTRKNSLGPSRKQIKASLVWWNECPDDNDQVEGVEQQYTEDSTTDGVNKDRNRPRMIQRTIWNWNTATIDLLLDIQAKDKSRWKKIDEVLDLQAERGKGNMVWSNALGISPDDKLPFNKAGAMLEERTDILDKLHPLLGIRERYEFEPGKDFRLQLEAAKSTPVAGTSTTSFADTELDMNDE